MHAIQYNSCQAQTGQQAIPDPVIPYIPRLVRSCDGIVRGIL